MSESRLSCPGIKATYSGKWQVTYMRRDGTRGVDPYQWDSEAEAIARVNEYVAAGAFSCGWLQLFLKPDGTYCEFEALGPGAFIVVDQGDGLPALMLVLPEGSKTYLPLNRGASNGPQVWGWDGDENAPTIVPSIHYQGYWHGFMEKGYLRSC